MRACNRGATLKHGAFVDNELQDVYILRRAGDVKLDEIVLQREEVEDVRYFPWSEFLRAQRSSDPNFVPRSLQYVDLFEDYMKTKW